LIAAIKEGASSEILVTVGRAVATAQIAALPEARRQALGDVAAFSERLLNETVSMSRSPWMRFFITFDPATALRRVACPVFAVFGGRDLQVPAAANRRQLEIALKQGGNRAVTVKVYPEANHLFMPAVTGELAEYATLPKPFVASLLDDVATWIAAR
jgi:hypothetical protein